MNTITGQKAAIYQALKEGKVLTWLSVLRLCGCSKAATRIGELEKQGVVIEKGWTKTPTGTKVRTYCLPRKK